MKRALSALCGAALACAVLASATQTGSAFAQTVERDEPVVAQKPGTSRDRVADEPAVALRPTSTAPLPSAATGRTMDGDMQDIVYLSPRGPIFVRLHIQINGQPFRKLRDGFSETLFASLDTDKNGALDTNEMKQVPPPAQLSSYRANGVAQYRMLTNPVDSSPRDGEVTLEELIRYVGEAAGSSFEISTVQPRNRVETDMFNRIDADRDGRLTAGELQAARHKLWRMDVNDDELVSGGELAVNATNPRRAPLPPANPLGSFAAQLMAVDMKSPSAIVRKMLQLYDKFTRDKEGIFAKDGQLSVEELGLGPEMAARFDANRDGKLGNKEIATLFREPVAQIVLLVRLDTGETKKSSIQILAQAPAGTKEGLQARLDGDRRMRMTLGDTVLDVVTSERAGNQSELVGYFDVNFKGGDGDNNGYLDKNEVQNLGIPPGSFAPIDRDGDGKIFKKELLEYIRQQSLLGQSRAAISLSNENKSLFEMLDANDDDRLSTREFIASVERLKTWDRNGDGSIDQEELPRNFQMSFGLGQANLFGRPAQDFDQRIQSGQALPAPGDGPTWFTKMDRNRDGDVSQREFLGPFEAFTRLDSNADGLLTSAEASGAKVN